MGKKEKIIGSIAILMILIIFIAINFFSNRPQRYKEEDIFIEKQEVKDTNKYEEKKKGRLTVEIKGEVKKPDVYIITEGSIIKDLITEAGGITEKADLSKINQARKLKDGDCISIYSKDDSSLSTFSNGSQSASNDGMINVNTATKDELMKVPGIGEVTAAKIIEFREKNGNFKSLEDLKKVGRIGDKTLEKFKEKLEVR
ncbi:ComEA family DNA-binding protein [Desnuesiella massiliensis]|uniref:ComEA family DNA-binding protein n=1 Tax=Desnuesiella massiliensis TaxID=1650662 RepID=UPI0006E16AC3|nr:ComEA family DNA-binding protein [Desnuesiella massiliensis]